MSKKLTNTITMTNKGPTVLRDRDTGEGQPLSEDRRGQPSRAPASQESRDAPLPSTFLPWSCRNSTMSGSS